MGWAADQLSKTARIHAEGLGPTGRAWMDGLDGLIADLCREWGLTVGAAYASSTAALVLRAVMADGREAVLKLAIPGVDPTASAFRTLVAGRGRGYAEVLRHDAGRDALLLERLGPQLHELGLPLDAQIGAICATLMQAWAPPPPSERFTTGAEKAERLAVAITEAGRDVGHRCSQRTIDHALRCAEARARAFDPAEAVLAHGDAHAWNTLLASGDGPRRFKLVDPDGVFVERAYDLSISMREWSAELMAGDPVALGWERCCRLAELTGVAEEPIWQWGVVERTANGLDYLVHGQPELGRAFLDVSDAWAEHRGLRDL